MDCGDHKLHHIHGDSRTILDAYLSDKKYMPFREDDLDYPMKALRFKFKWARIRGDHLYDISLGPNIDHLYTICEFYKEVTLLRVSDQCVMEMNKWLQTRTGAFDLSPTTDILTNLLGDSDDTSEQEAKLKAITKAILKCDFDKENLTDPEVLPQADCIFTACLLDAISTDEEDYKRNLRKIVSLLKPGGRLILFGVLNTTYFMMGEEKLTAFKYDEKFLRKVFMDESLSIVNSEVNNRKSESDLIDYQGIIFILAHKDT